MISSLNYDIGRGKMILLLLKVKGKERWRRGEGEKRMKEPWVSGTLCDPTYHWGWQKTSHKWCGLSVGPGGIGERLGPSLDCTGCEMRQSPCAQLGRPEGRGSRRLGASWNVENWRDGARGLEAGAITSLYSGVGLWGNCTQTAQDSVAPANTGLEMVEKGLAAIIKRLHKSIRTQ